MSHRIGLSVGAISIALVLCGTLTAGRVNVPPSTVLFDMPGRADAHPFVAAAGEFVAVAWGASDAGRTDVFLAVSRDGGSTFAAPVQVNETAGEARLGGELPPRVALTTRAGAAVPDMAVLWTARGETTSIKVARSTDGGRTFTAPVILQSAAAAGDRGWPALAVDRQAGVHAIWLDHRGMAASRTTAGHTHKSGAEHDGAAMAQRSGLYYAAAGSGASGERELTKGVCYCCKTALAVGPTGTLYAAWRHVYPGNLRDMAFTMSRDGGRSFSPPLRVREDGWAINGCPDDGPAMSVDAGGGVHLVWPTVIGGENPEGALIYASTADGRQFTPGLRVPTLGGPKPSHPQIAIDRVGRMFVAWDENVDGRRVAAMRQLQARPGSAPTFGEPIVISPEGGMYPVLAATNTGVVAVWSTGGEHSVVRARIVTH